MLSQKKYPHLALRKHFGQKKSHNLERRGQKAACVPTPVEITSNINRCQLPSAGQLPASGCFV